MSVEESTQIAAEASTKKRNDFLHSHRRIRVEISPKSVLWLFLLAICLWLFTRLLPVVLMLVVALMITGTLGPAIDSFEKHGLGRGRSIALVFSILLIVIALILVITVPPLIDQIKNLIESEPAIRGRLVGWLANSPLTEGLADALRNVKYDDLIKSSAASLLGYSTRIVEIAAYGIGAIFLALYILIDRDRLRGALFAVIPRSQHIRLSRIMVNLEAIVGGYIKGQAITCALMGAFMFILLELCNVPNALAIAAFGGLADVLPYIGIFLTIGPAMAAALPVGKVTGIVVLLALLVYEEIESRILVPVVYGKALRLPSSVVLIALVSGATIFGIIGALLALPIAAAILMLIDELRVELPGETLQPSDAELKAKDVLGERDYVRRTQGMPAEEAAAIAIEMVGDRMKSEDKAAS